MTTHSFLNDDIEIINEEWLDRMVGHAVMRACWSSWGKAVIPE